MPADSRKLLPYACLALLLLFGLSLPASIAQANVIKNKPDPKTPIAGTGIPYGILPQGEMINRDAVAIVIGNKNYTTYGKNVPDVDYAHNDADLIKAFLIQSLGFREGNIITLKDATFNELVANFGNATYAKGKLYNLVREKQSDLFVFYSGHGAPSLHDGQGYLLPVDADPEVVELTGYPLTQFYKNIEKIPARSKTVMIDACFSGNSSGGSIVKDASSITLKLSEVTAPTTDMTLLTAAGLAEVASWDHASKTGLFTRHFIEGVSGKADESGYGNSDGAVSLKELTQYLQGEVSYSARSLYQRKQYPQVKGNTDIFLAMWNAKLEAEKQRAEQARIQAEQKRQEEQSRIERERIAEEQREAEAAEKQRQRELEQKALEAQRRLQEQEAEQKRLAAQKLKELKELEELKKQLQAQQEALKNQQNTSRADQEDYEVFIPPSF